MALAGRLSIVAVGTDGTTFSTVDDLASCQMSWGGTIHDVSKFGDTWLRRLAGIKDNSFSLGGFYNQADTNGQVVMQNAKISDSQVWVMFKPNGTAGWKQAMLIDSWQVNTTEAGVQELSVTLVSAGGTIYTV